MKKCLHANNDRPSEDRLTTVQFHPSAQVVMTAGLDQSISLFQVFILLISCSLFSGILVAVIMRHGIGNVIYP